MRPETIGVGFAVFIVAVIISGFVLMSGYDVVDASHIGVMNRFGELTGTMMPGIRWTGVFTHVEQYDLRERTMTVDLQGSNSALSNDGQTVYATIQINYRLKPDSTIEAYSKVGVDKEMSRILNLEGIVREGFKTVTARHQSFDIFQKRDDIKDEAIKEISSKFPEKFFILDNVILANIDFNPEFKAAIEGKKVAEQTALQREQQVNIAKFEADMSIQNARGKSESAKLQADGEAYTRLAIAKSEAEALRLKKEQITELMVQNNLIDKWQGNLPQYMIVGSDSMQGMFLQLPTGFASSAK